MLDANEIRAKVHASVLDLARFSAGDTIADTADLRGDVGLDSFDFLELTITLEKEFLLEIDDSQVVDLKTFGDLVTYVSGHYEQRYGANNG